ncbi:MAG: hypothetical protein ACOC56_01080 [Atribacterota bacterium]
MLNVLTSFDKADLVKTVLFNEKETIVKFKEPWIVSSVFPKIEEKNQVSIKTTVEDQKNSLIDDVLVDDYSLILLPGINN